MRSHVLTAAAAVALIGLALTGCDASSANDKAAGEGAGKGGPSVIAPGKPGEENERLSPEEAAAKSDDDTPNSADFTYAEMMIEHHAQALVMTELAPERAKSAKVKGLAERIAAAQGPEIDAMKGWLKKHDAHKREDQGKGEGKSEGEPGGSHGHGDDHGGGHRDGHGDAPMPGMASEAQLKTLRAAKGAAFDELFLKLMITHHGGAVTMATDLLAEGNNIRIEEMANDTVAQQTAEINRMRGMS
ncbi:DUF305 domain-containing protein [Streptomyces sp. B-S-A12]|uniref:DUF305 domain-containing protein n=2 Tax=Streptomyces luteolus TaxID=3043615 RepID=A0ABT6T0W4_9ACTN|nr:DUF305 domain-containing protein [Streptomyces sp. B-S-A12]MDI3421492.1 DUF305 domain-containing protein [Streptomyces sp. B-S-A12]